jgi:hypothetical protein
MTPEERFWSKVLVTEGCWWWLDKPHRGYGRFSLRGRVHRAHRLAWELTFGALPVELVADHLCENKLCVFPMHLEFVPTAENIRRGPAGRHNALKTHCPHGHAYADTAVGGYRKRGRRKCGECERIRARAYQRRRRAH